MCRCMGLDVLVVVACTIQSKRGCALQALNHSSKQGNEGQSDVACGFHVQGTLPCLDPLSPAWLVATPVPMFVYALVQLMSRCASM